MPSHPKVSRRDFLACSLGAALAAHFLPASSFAGVEASGEFEFIAVNDLHFTDPKLCPPWFAKVFEAMRKSAPRAEFVLVSGDLSQDCTPEQFGGLKELFPLLKMPVHVTPGNHDAPVQGTSLELYEKFFPGTANYGFEHRGWQFFSLNSTESRAANNTKIPSGTLQWLDDNLKRFDPAKPTVISTHFPMGPGMIMRPTNADDLLERFAQFNLQHIFNGHWHGYSEMRFHGAPVTTDRCCSRTRSNHDGSPQKGWFVCQARDGKISRQFVSVPEGI
jgi:3',5'-cyclic AMP phosphodiesterase CpdA